MRLELAGRYLQGLTFRYLDRQHGKRWERGFHWINRWYLHWPVTVKYIRQPGLWRIEDAKGGSLVMTRTNKISRFRNGILPRLHALEIEYMVHQCSIEPGDIVIDIGANIGEFSKLMIDRYQARVIAIEPEILEFACLQENVSSKESICVNAAVWKENTSITLFHKNDTSDTSLIQPAKFDSATTVQVVTLDSISVVSCAKEVRLIKIEAEGAEPEVLEGAEKTLRRTRFVAVDCGPERGINRDATLVPVVRHLSSLDFELVGYYHARGTVLFEKRS